MKTNDAPTPLLICEDIINKTNSMMVSRKGFKYQENVLYWAGFSLDQYSVVTTCIAPEAKLSTGSFYTSSVSNAKVIAYLSRYHLQLIAQLHTHCGDHIEHSHGDDLGALMPFDGFFSIVVPHYGTTGIWPISKCGIYYFSDSSFRKATDIFIEQNISLIPSNGNLRKGKC